MKREVWITGVGVVGAQGVTADAFWNAICEGIPCEEGVLAERKNGAIYLNKKKFSKTSMFKSGRQSQADQRRGFVLESAGRALYDADLTGRTDIGAIVSCARPTMGRSEKWLNAMEHLRRGEETLDFAAPIMGSVEIPCVYILKKMGIAGPSYAVSGSCVSGLLAILSACRLITLGDADIILAGAVEVVPETAFLASYKNMNIFTDTYDHFRPYHKKRNGFFISEGCGIVVLESPESAKKRNKKPYAIIEDWVSLSDATSMTGMDSDGNVIAEMLRRLTCDGDNPVEYINLHGTATKINDLAETRAVKTVLSDTISCSAIKPQTGHMLGASSVVEVVATALAVHHQTIPPTIRLDEPDKECTLDYTPHKSIRKSIKRAISLSYGFGGVMAGVSLRRYE